MLYSEPTISICECGGGGGSKLFPINSTFYHGFPPDINNGKVLKCFIGNLNDK